MTNSRKIYSNAPITEAVIEIGFRSNAAPSAGDILSQLGKVLSATYPNSQMVTENTISIDALGKKQPQHNVKVSGVRFVNTAKNQICTVSSDRFTFSRLAPYENWESFSGEAKQIWDLLSPIAKPDFISRAAVRFINRFDLPGTRVEPEEYFNIYPKTPEGFDLTGLLLQMQMDFEDIQSQAVINQTLVPPSKPGEISLIMDFDLFSNIPRAADSVAIWQFFERLHLKKNELFESSITQKARELIA